MVETCLAKMLTESAETLISWLLSSLLALNCLESLENNSNLQHSKAYTSYCDFQYFQNDTCDISLFLIKPERTILEYSDNIRLLHLQSSSTEFLESLTPTLCYLEG